MTKSKQGKDLELPEIHRTHFQKGSLIGRIAPLPTDLQNRKGRNYWPRRFGKIDYSIALNSGAEGFYGPDLKMLLVPTWKNITGKVSKTYMTAIRKQI